MSDVVRFLPAAHPRHEHVLQLRIVVHRVCTVLLGQLGIKLAAPAAALFQRPDKYEDSAGPARRELLAGRPCPIGSGCLRRRPHDAE